MPGIGAQDWDSTLTTAAVAGAAVTTNTADTTLLPAANNISFSPNYFARAGEVYRVTANGQISNIVTTPGTLTFKLWLGPTKNIAVLTSQALQLNTTAQTNDTWTLDLLLTLRAIGSGTSANLIGVGKAASVSFGTGAVQPPSVLLPATAPAVGTGFDSTVTTVLDLTANFSLTGNSITLFQFAWETLNA